MKKGVLDFLKGFLGALCVALFPVVLFILLLEFDLITVDLDGMEEVFAIALMHWPLVVLVGGIIGAIWYGLKKRRSLSVGLFLASFLMAVPYVFFWGPRIQAGSLQPQVSTIEDAQKALKWSVFQGCDTTPIEKLRYSLNALEKACGVDLPEYDFESREQYVAQLESARREVMYDDADQRIDPYPDADSQKRCERDYADLRYADGSYYFSSVKYEESISNGTRHVKEDHFDCFHSKKAAAVTRCTFVFFPEAYLDLYFDEDRLLCPEK